MGITSVDWSKYGIKDEEEKNKNVTSVDWSKYESKPVDPIPVESQSSKSSREFIANIDPTKRLLESINKPVEAPKVTLPAIAKIKETFNQFKEMNEASTRTVMKAQKAEEAAYKNWREGTYKSEPPIIRDIHRGLDNFASSKPIKAFDEFALENYTPGAGLSVLNSASQSAGNLISKSAPALAKLLGLRGGRVAETALAEAIVGAPTGVGNVLARNPEASNKDILEGAAYGAGGGALLGGLGKGILEGLDAGKDVIRKGLENLTGTHLQALKALEGVDDATSYAGNLRPADRSAYLNRIVPELSARVNEIMTPPLENPSELAKWIKPYLGDNLSLNEVQKLSYEDMRQLAEEIRGGMSKSQIATEVAKKMGYDLPNLLKGKLPTFTEAGQKIPIFAPHINISRPLMREPITVPQPIRRPANYTKIKGYEVGDEAIPTSTDGTELSGARRIIDIQSKDGVNYYRFDGDNSYVPENQIKRSVADTNTVPITPLSEFPTRVRPIGMIDGKPAETYMPTVREPVPLKRDEVPFTFNGDDPRAAIDDYARNRESLDVQTAKTGTNDVTGPIAHEFQIFDPAELNQLSGIMAYGRDFFRNMEKAMGPHASQYTQSFDAAKRSNIDMQEYWLGRLKNEVVDKLGIKKDSKLSSLVQQFGEKKITLDDLKAKVPKDWEKVVEADKWFRESYDHLIDIVNGVRVKVYPNSPDKLVPKRDDYYRHFRELDGLEGLKNLFDTPANIDPSLAGTSDFTKPKSKFAGFMQRRGVGKYKNDAVGGFLNYMPSASYAASIDPETAKLRSLAQAIRGSSADGSNNTFIEYLDDFANDLAGKTNPADRFVQKVVSRKVMGAVNWFSNRIKSNTILANAASTIAQTANIPVGIAHAKQYAAPGFIRAVAAAFKKDTAMAQSGFLKERFAQEMYRQFDTDWLTIKNPLHIRKFAEWTMETADKIGTNFIWSSAYEKALAENVANPIAHADDVTRKIVAGRGIGETPLFLKSNTGKLVAPFQLEVSNLWHVMHDFVKKKDFAALAVLFTANWLFNRGMEEVRGSGVTFDPIQATMDAMEEGLTTGERFGRIGGEILSNLPLGQTVASGLIGSESARKKYFGDNDPTRFGTGIPITKLTQNLYDGVINGNSESLKKAAFQVLPGFGGNQLRKTIDGVEALNDGADFTPKGELKHPIDDNTVNAIRAMLFGPSATAEGKQYYKNGDKPLGLKDTEYYNQTDNKQQFYDDTMKRRNLDKISKKMRDVQKDEGVSIEQKMKRLEELSVKFYDLRDSQ